MAHATVTFTGLDGLAGTSFPKVSELPDQQLHFEPRISSEYCFEDIFGKSQALRKVLQGTGILNRWGRDSASPDIPVGNAVAKLRAVLVVEFSGGNGTGVMRAGLVLTACGQRNRGIVWLSSCLSVISFGTLVAVPLVAAVQRNGTRPGTRKRSVITRAAVTQRRT